MRAREKSWISLLEQQLTDLNGSQEWIIDILDSKNICRTQELQQLTGSDMWV